MAEPTLAQLPLSTLSGVGSKAEERLQKLGLFNVQDLLFHLPLRYEDRTRIFRIAELQIGMHVTVEAEILNSEITMRSKRILQCRIGDEGSVLTLKFFYFSAAMKNKLQIGRRIRCFGEIRRGPQGYEIIHPEYKLLSGNSQQPMEQELTAIYPTTEGIKQNSFRNYSDQALTLLKQYPLPELLPRGLYAGQLSINEALAMVHRPDANCDIDALQLGQHSAQQSLAIEELVSHNLSLLKLRQRSNQHKAKALPLTHELIHRYIENLPFSPTAAQQRVIKEIEADIQKPEPMMRLVQGDVGSGKTLVAAIAALNCLGNGFQAALMAPTEILAEQHALAFESWFTPLGIKVGWLAGRIKGKARQKLLDELASGEIQMLVGTHAIFQEQVEYNNLAIVIVDEQHRFGVHQRLALRNKGEKAGYFPHQLIMTATPIPRTLAMTAYADLDTSIIDELPPGRTPVTTVVMGDNRRNQVIERVYNACHNEGRQAYWVCTLIEESEVIECQAAEDTASELQNLLPDLRVGLVHGRLKADEKQWVMDSFKAGQLDLLVATTVIEVGVDVANASLMIIENPERLGLAQLHQLRGRVGRGAVASHCLLMYHHPLSQTASTRLSVLRETSDGFIIAQKDLEIRGPGELLGSRQTGLASLKVADLLRDQALIPQVQRLAQQVIKAKPEYVQALIFRWLGERDIYAQV